MKISTYVITAPERAESKTRPLRPAFDRGVHRAIISRSAVQLCCTYHHWFQTCRVSVTLPCIVLELLLRKEWLVAHITIGFSLTASVGAIANCLFLEGACRGFCSSGCLHIHYLLQLAALQASMCPGRTGYVVIVLADVLRMRCMLSLSVMLCSL